MVGSRHLQGTIISRVKYLLESGSLKNPPVWFNIVKRFPPPSTSLLSLVDEVEQSEIPKITYPADDIKRSFLKQFERAIRDPDTLFADIAVEETKTALFLKKYNELSGDGLSHDEALEGSLTFFQQHLDSIREQKHSSKESQPKEKKKTKDGEPDITLDDFYNMFKQKE